MSTLNICITLTLNDMMNPIKILNNFSLTEKLNLLQKQFICANDLNHAYDFSN